MNPSIYTSLIIVIVIMLLYEIFVHNSNLISFVNASTILLIVIILFVSHSVMRVEMYENSTIVPTSNALMSYEEFLKKYFIKDTKELDALLRGSYNEDLTPIYNSNLTLYYSVFSIKSYQITDKKMWHNISPFFENFTMKDCPSKNQIPSSHMNIGNMNINLLDRYNGIQLDGTKIYGPLSYQLGFDASVFSIFFMFKFNDITPIDTAEHTNIYHIFGNTLYNNAVDLNIVNSSVIFDDKETYTMKFSLRYAGDAFRISSNVDVNINDVHLISLVKDGLNIVVALNDMTRNTETIIFKITLDDSHKADLLLSNKPFVLNESGTMDVNIYAFAVVNQAVVDKMYILKYLSNELYKISEDFRELASVYLSTQTLLEKSMACPYDVTTCDHCKGVVDWRNPDISKFSSECLTSMNKSCTKDPTLPLCDCWSKENENNTYCKKYKSIFDQSIDLCPAKIIDTPLIQTPNACEIYTKCLDEIIIQGDWNVSKENLSYYDKA